MAIFHITIKSKLMPVLLVFSLLLSTIASMAQTYVNAPMTGTPAAGAYYSNTSILLNPTFSFTAASNSSLSLYIVGPDCVPQTTTLSASKNYIFTSEPRIDGITTTAGLANRSTCELMQTVEYFDGLGRPLQSIQIKGSPSDKDLVQPFAYDVFGREVQKYLPYSATTADGSYKTDAFTSGAGVMNFYYPAGSTAASGTQQSNGMVYNPKPFAVTNFEPSPLNRATELGAPGTDWQPVTGNTTGHTVKIVYTINNATAITDSANTMIAALYGVTINTDGSRTLTRAAGTNANYLAAQLDVGITKDENWRRGRGGTTETYKDNDGRVVLKRTFNYSGTTLQVLSTYYVYDDLGNLAFVLPPMSNADNVLPVQTVLDNLCYQYRYDEQNRLIQKKLPGKGWEYVVYNKLNQPVLTQDAIQRLTNQWAVAKYDALGRVVMTGLWNAGAVKAQSTLQANIYAAAQWDTRDKTDVNTGYAVSSYPAISSYLSINYYDDYSFSNVTGLPPVFNTMPSGASSQATGLLTGSKVNILGTGNMLWAVSYYDDFGRNVQTYKQHYLGGGTPNVNNYDVITNSYDFTNVVTATIRKHYNTTSTTAPVLTVTNAYVYDHMGRKTQTFEQLNGGVNVLLSQVDYNDIGQMKIKHLHSTNMGASFLQNASYAYNERGWLSRINDPNVAPAADKLFSMALNYNTPVPANNGRPQYNGNIAEQLYNKGSVGQKFVTYNYDQLNRLTAGNSAEAFSENSIAYDANGNIQGMTRFGPNSGILSYIYSGNQLQSVTSNNSSVTRSYSYDVNGNATSDGQGNTINYNLLNLPASIPGKSLTYSYDAAGNKLRKISSGAPTDYVSGIQYKADGTIDFIQTEEGRAIKTGANYIYEYTLSDHLGNNRVTFDQTNGKVGEDDYYPFGLNVHRQQNAGNKYLYNSKEMQDELNEYDYGARFYDPVIARWNSIDPLAEKSRRWSPYNYVEDNPIRNIDLDGMLTYDYNTGSYRDANGQEVPTYEAMEQIAGMASTTYFVTPANSTNIASAGGSGNSTGNGQQATPEENKSSNQGGADGTTTPETSHFTDIDLGGGETVKVYFQNTSGGASSDNEVSTKLVTAVVKSIAATNNSRLVQQIESITISATTNGKHAPNSNHSKGLAVDISAINGIHIKTGQVDAIVQMLQVAFEFQPGRRENFGPIYMLKSGNQFLDITNLTSKQIDNRIKTAADHMDHIHWSVDSK
jgi:RHS repeat-associated protein